MRKIPKHGIWGLLLILIFWTLNWFLDGLRTHWAFFPMWLGYCLTVDALVFSRKGSSLLSRNLKKFILLFIFSVPVWWIFEFFNLFTDNWVYHGKEYFTSLEFFLLSSLSFSTVMPAVFETAELAATFRWIKNSGSGPKISDSARSIKIFLVSGLAMLILLLWFPGYFFPFIWISVYFILDPLNSLMNRSNLFTFTAAGNWKPVLALWIGVLICGFFWEFWNFYSYPKWVYHLQYLNILHVFEMPLFGYLGYLPFSLELYAFYNLFNKDGYIEI